MVKVSHKKYIRNWKPKCHFCPRRTVRALHLRSYTYVCDKCLRPLREIIFSNAGEEESWFYLMRVFEKHPFLNVMTHE